MRRLPSFFTLGLALFAAPVFAQTVTLEHFQCYTVRQSNPPMVIPVALLDQFSTAATGPETVDVVRTLRFCNPAGKFHRNQFFPIQDDRQHLTWYATFPQSAPLRIVTLSNQFDPVGAQSQTWLVREPVALAVPTQKPPLAQPEGLDHFRCYAAYNTAGLSIELVGLIDQFLTFGARAVLFPTLFCNPVQKTRLDTGSVTPILHPDLHLACYATTRVPFQTSRDIINQFGPQTVVLGPPDMLCVPTRKLSFVEIPDAATGAPSTPESAVVEFGE